MTACLEDHGAAVALSKTAEGLIIRASPTQCVESTGVGFRNLSALLLGAANRDAGEAATT